MPQYDINLREYWWIFKKRKFIIITIAIALGIFSTTFATLRAPEPLYSTTCVIEFEKPQTAEGIYGEGWTWSSSDLVDTHISVIKGYPVFLRVGEKMGLIPLGDASQQEDIPDSSVFSVIESLQSKVQVTRERFSSILNIKVTDNSPVFAQKLANTIAVTYKEILAEQQMRRTRETIRYIAHQLKEVRRKLKEAEDEFNRFSQENELISIDLQSEDLLVRAKTIRKEIRDLEEGRKELESIRARLETFVRDPSVSDHDYYSEKGGSRYNSANDRLVELLIKRDTLLEDYTERHPEVVAIDRDIIETARKMLFILKLETNRIAGKVDGLKEELHEVDKKKKVLMDKKLEFERLKRKVDLYHNMTVLLEKKNQEAMIRRADRPEVVNIIKPALLPTRPINPPKRRMVGATGTLIGIIVGLVVAFLIETFDTSLGAIEDVEETLGVQVLGVIPQVNPKDIRGGLKEKYGGKLKEHSLKESVNFMAHLLPKSMMAESFRGLRTNIQFKDADQELKTIALTSSTNKEGKTLVAINLAITMAQAGIQPLLVDCDLRKPSVGKTLGIETTVGVTDILLGNYQWRDTVKGFTDIIMGKMNVDEVMITPGLDNLHIITAGSVVPNTAELIESKRLDRFLEEVKGEYDIILIDSTPIISTADAAILGRKVDGVLLVYRVGSVSRALLRRSTTQLKQIKCNIVGVVLNSVRPEVSPDFQDFKHYRYYSISGEDNRGGSKKGKGLFVPGLRGEGKIDLGGMFKRNERSGSGKDRSTPTKLILLLVAGTFLAGGITLQYRDRKLPKPLSIKVPPQVPGSPEGEKKTQERKEGIPTTAEFPEEAVQSSTGKEPSNQSGAVPGEQFKALPKEMRRETAIAVEKRGALGTPYKGTRHPYSLKVGSFRNLEQARKAVSRYTTSGLAAYYVRVALSTGLWYRVYLGYFNSRGEAEKFKLDTGLTDTVVVRVPYTILIGSYRTKGDGQQKRESLKKAGYYSYWVEDGENRFMLCVGAFHSREGAEKKFRELMSQGIQGRVAER
ncbi:MAG: polysaccharide biosynthesis tyrosine autokinase [Deltaproteobacteria bacterium]|nr:polysaccharide biosynthesis tyrosine autokinase [Deltaproteobacteria bacterium]